MKIFKMLTTLAAFFAVALFSGCDDDKGSEPDPQPVKLASPGIVFKDVKPTSFAASWTAVEHAAAFGYKLLARPTGTVKPSWLRSLRMMPWKSLFRG